MAKAVGIDLGTTNSAVAVMESGKPAVIVNLHEDGRDTGRPNRQAPGRAQP
jgi:molecular chaperone DnaK